MAAGTPILPSESLIDSFQHLSHIMQTRSLRNKEYRLKLCNEIFQALEKDSAWIKEHATLGIRSLKLFNEENELKLHDLLITSIAKHSLSIITTYEKKTALTSYLVRCIRSKKSEESLKFFDEGLSMDLIHIENVIFEACDAREEDFLIKLLEKGISTSLPLDPDNGATFIHLAAEYGLFKVIRYLYENNYSFFVYDSEGLTPLHHAVLAGQRDVTLYLIDIVKLDPTIPDSENSNLLQYALGTYCNTHDIAFALIERGLSPLLENKQKEHSLHILIKFKKWTFFKIIFPFFSTEDLLKKTAKGNNCLMLAWQIGEESIITAIEDRLLSDKSFFDDKERFVDLVGLSIDYGKSTRLQKKLDELLEGEESDEYLEDCLFDPTVLRSILPYHRDKILEYLNEIEFEPDTYPLASELLLLPHLFPDEIAGILNLLTDQKIQDLANTKINLPRNEGRYPASELLKILVQRFGCLINREHTSLFQEYLKHIPLEALAANARASAFIKLFPILSPEQITVSVPYMNKEDLIEFVNSLPYCKKPEVIQAATISDRLAIIEEWKHPPKPLILSIDKLKKYHLLLLDYQKPEVSAELIENHPALQNFHKLADLFSEKKPLIRSILKNRKDVAKLCKMSFLTYDPPDMITEQVEVVFQEEFNFIQSIENKVSSIESTLKKLGDENPLFCSHDTPDFEFLDPITCTPITDPILLPDGHIINRDTLVKNNMLSPFNRSQLTLENVLPLTLPCAKRLMQQKELTRILKGAKTTFHLCQKLINAGLMNKSEEGAPPKPPRPPSTL